MKFKFLFMAALLTGALMSCGESNSKADPKNMQEVISRSEIKVEHGIMNPEVLYSFGRIGSVALSPDNSQILYQVSYVSIDQNKINPSCL